MAYFKILAFQDPKFKFLADFKILAFLNLEIQILPNFKILVFQNREFDIFTGFKILAFQNRDFQILVVSKMVSVARFSTPPQTGLIGKMTENANNKIPHYAENYKKEYLFIRGINKEFEYLINKLDTINDGLFESKTVVRIKNIMKDFLRGQEKGKLKNISGLMLPKYDYCYIQEFYIYYEIEFGNNPSSREFFDFLGKLYNKIKIEFVFSDYYGEGFCI